MKEAVCGLPPVLAPEVKYLLPIGPQRNPSRFYTV